MYKALLEFPEGVEGIGKNPSRGEGMDIFWNYKKKKKNNTFLKYLLQTVLPNDEATFSALLFTLQSGSRL